MKTKIDNDHCIDDLKKRSKKADMIDIESVNYFISRSCNFNCKFCFHTNKNNFILPINSIKIGLKKLKDSGLRKLNFSGGEPFIYADKILGPIIEYCKEELNIECVSIISNGSLITNKWIKKYGRYIDILGISINSFIKEKLIELGCGNGDIIHKIENINEWCLQNDILLKINTVINRLNFDENMIDQIKNISPFRWKCFKLLLINNENTGYRSKLNAESLKISNKEFHYFINKHKEIKSIIPEDNILMRNTYILLNEKFQFLNCTKYNKQPTRSILESSVISEFNKIGFDFSLYLKRGGRFKWKK